VECKSGARKKTEKTRKTKRRVLRFWRSQNPEIQIE